MQTSPARAYLHRLELMPRIGLIDVAMRPGVADVESGGFEIAEAPRAPRIWVRPSRGGGLSCSGLQRYPVTRKVMPPRPPFRCILSVGMAKTYTRAQVQD